MTDPSDELRAWAEAHAPFGSVQAAQVLWLLSRVAELEAFVERLSDRIHAAHEILANRAEKKGQK